MGYGRTGAVQVISTYVLQERELRRCGLRHYTSRTFSRPYPRILPALVLMFA